MIKKKTHCPLVAGCHIAGKPVHLYVSRYILGDFHLQLVSLLIDIRVVLVMGQAAVGAGPLCLVIDSDFRAQDCNVLVWHVLA